MNERGSSGREKSNRFKEWIIFLFVGRLLRAVFIVIIVIVDFGFETQVRELFLGTFFPLDSVIQLELSSIRYSSHKSVLESLFLSLVEILTAIPSLARFPPRSRKRSHSAD